MHELDQYLLKASHEFSHERKYDSGTFPTLILNLTGMQ